MAYQGIDYGRGLSNVDHETGIRYGVISQHSVGQAWYDTAESQYGPATCPKCGNEAIDAADVPDDGESGEDDWESGEDDWTANPSECHDYACLGCLYFFGSESAFGDEPAGWSVDDGEYQLTDCLDSDIFVIKSPYYTFAQFCSPCVPGAGNLDNPIEGGSVKAYCLGHEWFEDGMAPYTVYRVSDDSIVQPDEA